MAVCGGEPSAGDVLHTAAAAINGEQQHLALAPPVLQGVGGTGGRRLIDGVDDIDVGMFLKAVLHGGLAAGLVAVAVGHAHHFGGSRQIAALRRQARQAETLQKALVPLGAHRMAGEQIEGGDARRCSCQAAAAVATDQLAGPVVVGGQ